LFCSGADPEIFERGERKTVYQPSHFLSQMHIELYSFYAGKGDVMKIAKAKRGRGGRPRRPAPSPAIMNPPL